MRILQIISSVDSTSGGVVEGVRMFSEEWTQAGHSVEVLTLDPPGFPDAGTFPVPVHTLGPGKSAWLYSGAFYPWLRDHHREYDFIVVHALWQYHVFGAWRALHGQTTPYVVFTHGMLDPYFKRRFPLKHLKKWLFWPWSEYRALRDARAVMFTCEEERVLARESFFLYKAKELVVGFGTNPCPVPLETAREAFLERFPELQGKRILTFMGRLAPKKACDLLIEAFASTLAKDPDWQLVMAGPDLDDWKKDLLLIAKRLQIQDRVIWTGMLHGDLKWGSIAASEVLTLPSHQENFGVVVAEALACSVPVIVSNQVNIWREIEAFQAGMVTADTLAGIQASLQRWSTLTAAELQEMRSRCLPCFQKYFDMRTVCLGVMAELERLAPKKNQPEMVNL